MEDCIKCGMSLSGGDLTLPWEDDDNPNAYDCFLLGTL